MKTVKPGVALAEHVAGLEYGDVIPRKTIERISGANYGPGRYYTCVHEANKIILMDGKQIRPCGGGDYQVLYPGDFNREFGREVTNAARRIKRAGDILASAPVNDMSVEERATHTNLVDFNARLYANMAGSVTTVRQLTHKKPNPLKEAYGK